jgi:hypothetical protein
MTPRIRRKLVILTVSCSVLLQLSGCIGVAFQALLDASLTALLNNIVTQFLPLNRECR